MAHIKITIFGSFPVHSSGVFEHRQQSPTVYLKNIFNILSGNFMTFRQWVTFLNFILFKYNPVHMAQQAYPGHFCQLYRRALSPCKGKISFVVLWEFSHHVSVHRIYFLLALCQLESGKFFHLNILGHCHHHSHILSSCSLGLWSEQLMEPSNHTSNPLKQWDEIILPPANCLCQVYGHTYLQTLNSKRCLLVSLKRGTQILLCLELFGALGSVQGSGEKLEKTVTQHYL